MRPKTKVFLLAAAALACVGAAVNRLELPVGKITVRVVDEAQKPVVGAVATFTFTHRLTSEPAPVAVATNREGLATAEGAFGPAGFGFSITKQGYYRGGAPIPDFTKIDRLTNHWLPWNQTYTTVLRPVISPVPMYARDTWITIPVAGEPCGFDLEQSDWVAPYGRGTAADLVFTLDRRNAGPREVTSIVKLSFTQPLDGIQPAPLPPEFANSQFKWPRAAPDTGYAPSLSSRRETNAKGIWTTATQHERYFIRVRTAQREGRIVSAAYGKIDGGLELDDVHSNTCSVHLRYYLNPTPLDRNLEWDPKRDLLTGLRYDEKPREP